jgi:hypothetical protein
MYATLESPVECGHVCWDQCGVEVEVLGPRGRGQSGVNLIIALQPARPFRVGKMRRARFDWYTAIYTHLCLLTFIVIKYLIQYHSPHCTV